LALNGEYTSDSKLVPLTELGGYSDVDALAERLLSQFESLPWLFSLTLNIPQSMLPPLPSDGTRMKVMERSDLVTTNLLLDDEFPLETDNKALRDRITGTGLASLILGDEPLKWEADASYFQTQVEGFVGPYGGSTPMDVATERFKAFFGLGLALGLFSHEYKYIVVPHRVSWTIHRKIADQWQLRDRLNLDDEDSRLLGSISLWNKFGKDYPEEHKVTWLKGVLKRTADALNAAGSETLRLASRWYWDSFKGTDEILRYVRRMTTLEIILGEGVDTSKASLGEIVGNRLAYLVGTSHSHRAEVLAKFKRIYQVRSSILHRGKARLSADERSLLIELQTLCESALRQEATLVAKPAL
jgi:hypothetical protein